MNRKEMIDNLTAVLCQPPPDEILQATGPIMFSNIMYSPVYMDGQIRCFRATASNMRISVFTDRTVLQNSLHKYWHGNNCCDFFASEIASAIQQLNYKTGIDWSGALIKKIECGVNIPFDPVRLCSSLKSYKGRSFDAMIGKRGKKYGVAVGFSHYRMKSYNKSLAALMVDGIQVPAPLTRWELSITNSKYFTPIGQPLTVSRLIQPDTLLWLSTDAINKFETVVKMEQLDLRRLTAEEKKVCAVMLIPEIREDFKKFHPDSYKKYRRIFTQILKDQDSDFINQTTAAIKKKFDQLLSG